MILPNEPDKILGMILLLFGDVSALQLLADDGAVLLLSDDDDAGIIATITAIVYCLSPLYDGVAVVAN